MPRCPRCDGKTDQLHPIPSEALVVAGGAEESRGKACLWCVHEITEG